MTRITSILSRHTSVDRRTRQKGVEKSEQWGYSAFTITGDTEMFSSFLIFLLILPCLVLTLHSFDPWSTGYGLCQSSMNSCSFHLRATSAMSMFYKQLFRLVADDDGVLHKYDDQKKIYHPNDVITADGYPKLVCLRDLSWRERDNMLSIGLCL